MAQELANMVEPLRRVHHRGDGCSVCVLRALLGNPVCLRSYGYSLLDDLNYFVDIAERIKREVPPDLLPDEDLDLLFRLYAVLGSPLGEKVKAKNVHAAWSAWMSQTNPKHNSMRPFEDLPTDVHAQDEPFVEAIRKVAANILWRGAPCAYWLRGRKSLCFVRRNDGEHEKDLCWKL